MNNRRQTLNDNFSFDKQYTRNQFTDMLSESFGDIKRRKQITEEQEQLLEQEYNDLISNTMNEVKTLIKRNAKLLKKQIAEHLKNVTNENYRNLNTTKQSLFEDLEGQYLNEVSNNLNIISEEILDNY